MTNAINSLMCFPPVSWWKEAVCYEKVYTDPNEPFRKMTCRNRYRIATANGLLQLSVPIMGGREQRKPMREIMIDNKTDWQKQHWRSVFSAYGRAPFFEHFGPELEYLFQQRYEYLIDFNQATIGWAAKNLRMQQVFVTSADDTFLNTADDLKRKAAHPAEELPAYTQVFEDRFGFMPDLSVVDLLMNEGPAAKVLLLS